MKSQSMAKQWKLTQTNEYQLPLVISPSHEISILQVLKGNKFIIQSKDEFGRQIYFYDPPRLTLLINSSIKYPQCIVNDKLVAFAYGNIISQQTMEIYRQCDYDDKPSELKCLYRNSQNLFWMDFFKVEQKFVIGRYQWGGKRIFLYHYNETTQQMQEYKIKTKFNIKDILNLKQKSYYSITTNPGIYICKLKVKTNATELKLVRVLRPHGISDDFDIQSSAEDILFKLFQDKEEVCQQKYGLKKMQKDQCYYRLSFYADNRANYKNMELKNLQSDSYFDENIKSTGLTYKTWLQKYTMNQINLNDYFVSKCRSAEFPRLQKAKLIINSIKLFKFSRLVDSSTQGEAMIIKEFRINE